MTPLNTDAVADALQAFINTGTPRDAMEGFAAARMSCSRTKHSRCWTSNLARLGEESQGQAIFGLRKQAMVAAREHGVEAGVAQLYSQTRTRRWCWRS